MHVLKIINYNCTNNVFGERQFAKAAEMEETALEPVVRKQRPRSASFVAVRSALYQLTRLSDFKTEKIGAGFFADVFKVEGTFCDFVFRLGDRAQSQSDVI